ncbi:MAG TPA: class I tRNA ligase family protein, partial [Candidatus Nanoarchaeia archaeon]|nr:class I tRNA ligase family protein [Candidatus Nanoarchaeia archaeon]
MIQNYDALKSEPEIMEFWHKHKIYEKAKEQNKDKTKFYFLDGPPYTSGKVHLGTAWNKSLKDSVLRFKRMNGFDVWDRAGYDMHGMPTELAVEKKLGLKHKEDIPVFGVASFVKECREFALTNLELMNKDFKRIGVWMDFENAYQSITKDFINGEWWLIRKAFERNRLYEGERAMTWCSSCATSLAKHELEYEDVNDNSIFVKFKSMQNENEFFIIWTTTPWTIPFNLAIVVHPDFDYAKCKVGDETWILAKELAKNVIEGKAEKKFEIIKDFKGRELEGSKYEPPFPGQFPQIAESKKEQAKIFTVLLSEEYVHLEEGTGIVHFAPGCGESDYELCLKNGIKPFNLIDEHGKYPDEPAIFRGLFAKKDDKKFIELMEQNGTLIAQAKINHSYAHCWRCKNPVIYKTTKQWFFKVEDLKDKMRELNKQVKWVPDFAGSKNFDNWLANLRDNGITRHRYWGTPLPIWK